MIIIIILMNEGMMWENRRADGVEDGWRGIDLVQPESMDQLWPTLDC